MRLNFFLKMSYIKKHLHEDRSHTIQREKMIKQKEEGNVPNQCP